MASPFRILRVPEDADDRAVREAYLALVVKFHPDNPTTGDRETFELVHEAFEQIDTEEKRRALRAGSSASSGAPGDVSARSPDPTAQLRELKTMVESKAHQVVTILDTLEKLFG